MEFIKMHGAGNDYVYVDCFRGAPPADPARVAREISKMHTGVGADGLILIEKSETCDARMRMFNRDGSEGGMCGNGIRCVGKYVYDSGIARKGTLLIETASGVKTLTLIIDSGVCTGARADMGVPRFSPADVPVRGSGCDVEIAFPDGARARFLCVSMGNPHAVTFDLFPEEDAFSRLGAFVETHPIFPDRINVSFCRVDGPHDLTARVWERGSGATMACGTGACASFAAACARGLIRDFARVRLPGGTLIVEWKGADAPVYLTGPAATCFTGTWPESNTAPSADAIAGTAR